jgi:aspartyl-tRNA synthetase
MEMAFANSSSVMHYVELLLLKAVWPTVPNIAPLQLADTKADSVMLVVDQENGTTNNVSKPDNLALKFPTMTYEEAMRRYGSDKPDIRINAEIRRVEHWLQDNAKSMISRVNDAVVEMFKLDMQGASPEDSQQLIQKFSEFYTNAKYSIDPDRSPGWAVYNPRQPLSGLSVFGHDTAAKLEEDFKPEPGDILVYYSRPDKPFFGGSTALGDLRRDLHAAAVFRDFIQAPTGFAPLWIIDFPLFSPVEDGEPGQGGNAGLCSTHHPFTAPKSPLNVELDASIPIDPLSLRGDHYDLVINGVEIGGGSVRIHQESLQRYILTDVLKLSPERVANFEHLLTALKCGCPPHAGFALGFDRLMAMITGVSSVRDVIAFPKEAKGEDVFVGAPSFLNEEQLKTYHLNIDNPDNTFHKFQKEIYEGERQNDTRLWSSSFS